MQNQKEEMKGEDSKAIFYCDESGNSGPNYIDQEQPFYTLAAWSVPYERIVDASVAVEEHRQEYSPQATELKAANLMRSAKGKRGIISLLRTLGQIGCVPIYEVLEKRYCVAAKIVETFLDPAYNPRVYNAFIPDSTTKQEIANTLYEGLSESTLNQFAAIYRNPTLDGFKSSLDEIVARANANINSELATLLEGSHEQLAEIAEIEASACFLGNMTRSLNHPVFVGMLMMIEVLGRLDLVEPVKIVHDEIYAYEEHMDKMFVRLRRAREGVFTFPNGHILVFPLKHVGAMEFGSSKDSVLLQAADVLAGSVNYLAKRAIQKREVTDLDSELGALLFPALLIDLPRIAWSVGSPRWVGQLGSYYFAQWQTDEGGVSDERLACRTDWFTPAPLLPAGAEGGSKERQTGKYDIPIPIYALVEKESVRLISVEMTNPSTGLKDAAVVLFSEEQYAEELKTQFATEREEDEGLVIRLFGPADIHELVFQLDQAKESAGMIVFDPNTKNMALTSLKGFVLGLKRMLDRIKRAIESGIYKQMFQLHKVGGVEIMSYLCADGSYVAGTYPDGKIYHATSREDAVAAVIREDLHKG